MKPLMELNRVDMWAQACEAYLVCYKALMDSKYYARRLEKEITKLKEGTKDEG